MKTETGGRPTRRWIRERKRAIYEKFWSFLEDEDEDGLRYWLIYEAELDEGSTEFQLALQAWNEKLREKRNRRRQRR